MKGRHVVYQVKGLDEQVSDFILWNPSEGVGQGHQDQKNMVFKGSHVVCQMKGIDEQVSDIILWSPSEEVGQVLQVQKKIKFLKGRAMYLSKHSGGLNIVNIEYVCFTFKTYTRYYSRSIILFA